MSGTAFPGLDEILTLPCKDLRKKVSDVMQTWTRLKKLHQTETDHIDADTLIFLLPFSSTTSCCICKTVQDQNGQINWRFCLASIALLVSGTILEKINLIQQLYERENSFNRVLKDVLRCAQRIAISLNVEINSFRPKCNIGSARYHGEDNLTILVNELLKDYSESEDTLNLQKPLKFCWSQVKNAGTSACRDFPCSRVKHSACVSGQQIYVLGGRDGRYPVNDLWTYDLLMECWSKLQINGAVLPNLEGHSMVSYGSQVLVFGGVSRMCADGETPLWILDTNTGLWKHWTSSGEVTLPPCLKGHTAVVTNKNMYIFGGYEDILGSTELMWSFDIIDEQWHLVYSHGMKDTGPSPRNNHTATLHNNCMIIIGGINNLNPVTDMWSWSFRTQYWTKIKPASASPPIVYNHAAVKVSNSIYVYGGENETGLSKSIWEYKIDSAVWKCKELDGSTIPSSLKHHIGLLVSPSVYRESCNETRRIYSVPAMREISTDKMSRPRTSHSNYSVFTSNKVHPWSSDYLFSSKNKKRNSLIVSTESNNESSSVHFNNNNSAFTLDGYSKESCMKQSKSDYTVVSYFRSDSQDKLLKRQSSTFSDSSFIFDNPAYVNSHEMLAGQVDVTAAAMPYSYNRTGYYGRLSRSLDSIRDVVHDSNPLYGAIPGSVVSQSEESVCGTCTVRNIVLDECSQAWDESWLEDDTITTQDDSPTTHYHQASNFPKQYRLYIIGGQKISTRSSVTEDHLVMWKADIYSKSSKNEKAQKECTLS